MKILYFIPARKGSKRFPKKNLAIYRGLPLFMHSINHARMMTTDDNICLSTDSEKIKSIAEDNGLEVPFLRPEPLADGNHMRAAVLYSLYRYEGYDAVMVLQPTSPLREKQDMETAIQLYETGQYDAVFSSDDGHNPNGVIYLISVKAWRRMEFADMHKISFKSQHNLDINYKEDME